MRSREFRRFSRNSALREYFYGKVPHPLFPFSFDVPFAEIKIFKIGGILGMSKEVIAINITTHLGQYWVGVVRTGSSKFLLLLLWGSNLKWG